MKVPIINKQIKFSTNSLHIHLGVKAFTLPLSEFVSSGRWLLHVEVDSAEFTAPIDIAPGIGGGIPDVAAAEEHYVELRFGREMRRRYKPGLPFSGKVCICNL